MAHKWTKHPLSSLLSNTQISHNCNTVHAVISVDYKHYGYDADGRKMTHLSNQ